MFYKILVAFFTMFMMSKTFAVDTCEVFYKTALYDEIHTKIKNTSKSFSLKEFCSAYESYKTKKNQGALNVIVKSLPVGGSLSLEDQTKVASNMCDKNITDTMDSTDVDIFKKIVSKEGSDIVKSCLDASAKGLKVKDFRINSNKLNNLTLSIVWNPPTGIKSDLIIKSIKLLPDETKKISCSGSLWNLRKGGIVKQNINSSITCTNSSDSSAVLVMETTGETLIFPIEPSQTDLCPVQQKIADFIRSDPRDKNGNVITDGNVIYKEDISNLVLLYEELITKCTSSKDFNQYKMAHFDLVQASHVAQNRAVLTGDQIVWRLEFFDKYRAILDETKDQQTNLILKMRDLYKCESVHC